MGDTHNHTRTVLNIEVSAYKYAAPKNGQLITKPIKLAQLMNEYFIDKVKTLPTTNVDPNENIRKLMENNQHSFNLNSVHPDDILTRPRV